MDLDDIRALDKQLEPHRSEIGSQRQDMKEIYKGARKKGIDPTGFKAAKRLEAFKPTKRRAFLETFRATLEALEIDAQVEMHLVGGRDVASGEAPAVAPARASRSRLKPPTRGTVRGKGGIGRRGSPPPAA